jgi:hypothetical protein
MEVGYKLWRLLVKMHIDKKRFRKIFPNIANEMEGKEQGVEIDSIRSDIQTGDKASPSKFATYIPDVIDFIRRCDNEQQAEEIINYLAKRGEVSHNYAQRLKRQLKEKGVRSFGTKKEEGYYLKQGGL